MPSFVFLSKSSRIWKHFFKYLFSDELVKTERYLDKIFLLTDPQFSDSSNILYSKNPPCLVYIIYIYKDKNVDLLYYIPSQSKFTEENISKKKTGFDVKFSLSGKFID